MTDAAGVPPVDRATAVFEPAPAPSLRCSNCAATVTDDDPECPACDSPLDWGASAEALRSMKQAEGGS
jgi:hypothetical protein